jgi:2-amino-4-hydroxy-6-hydroxymethyldihydropteridine diphosphokinase
VTRGVSRAYLALGSNLGDRASHLQFAVDALTDDAAVEVVDVSRVYETAPVGGPAQDAFLNAVVAVDTTLEPGALLALAQQIERAAHRVRVERWGPRTLDVDVLLYDDVRSDDPDLTLPHPRMWERGFVLAPLRDVAPALVDPGATWEGVSEAAVTLHIPWGNNSAPSP